MRSLLDDIRRTILIAHVSDGSAGFDLRLRIARLEWIFEKCDETKFDAFLPFGF